MFSAPFILLATFEGLLQAAVLSLTAVGLSLVFGTMRIVNVAHGEFYMLGAVFTWCVAALLGTSPLLSFFLSLVIAPIVVAAIAWVCARFILTRIDWNPEATIVATIGLMYILQQTVLFSPFGPTPKSVEAPFDWRIQFPGFGYSSYKLFVIVIAPLILLSVWMVLKNTKAGLIMRATQFDADTAAAFGIKTPRVYIMVFAIGAALAAIGAVLIVPTQQVSYLMGHDALLLSFTAVILGGLGSLRGTIIAALIIGMINGFVPMFYAPTLASILSMLLVACVLIWRPDGLFAGGRQ